MYIQVVWWQKSECKIAFWSWTVLVLSVMLWQTTSSVRCCPSSTTTSSWSQGRVGPARPRPPRKSFSTTLWAARVPDSWTTFETDYSSPIQCLRSVTWTCVTKFMLCTTILEKNGILKSGISFIYSFITYRLLEMPKPWRMTTQAALGNTWTSSLTTR